MEQKQRPKRYLVTERQAQVIFENKILDLLEEEFTKETKAKSKQAIDEQFDKLIPRVQKQ